MRAQGGTEKKPSGQKKSRRSGSPALLQPRKKCFTFVTEAKARELLPLNRACFATNLSPAGAIYSSDLFNEVLPPGRILLPPLEIRDTAPIAQEVAVPVLAATDAAVARLEAANVAFHIVVGTWEPRSVVAL